MLSLLAIVPMIVTADIPELQKLSMAERKVTENLE